MGIELERPISVLVTALLCGSGALLAGCVGSGSGLDANGNPIGSSSSAPPGSSAPQGLTADFQSIQDNIFTPICTKCHIGASAPEGLQLDAAHSYALLVGVPSAEVPTTLRVKPGDPTNSYIIQKLQNSAGIVGAQMPFGGPYLAQSTIDVIKQWITNGAPAPATATSAPGSAALAVSATMPADGSAVERSLATIAIGFSHQPDPSYLNRALRLERIGAAPADLPVMVATAQGNPATVLLTPLAPLPAGAYRITVHGGDAQAMTSIDGAALPTDYSFTFTVEAP
jgi:methionine-rich copper-binding protein CopC